MEKEIAELFTELRYKKPLIHQITNFVTMNDCANVTLAAGASPVMASSPCEAGEMAMLSEALVINIGTLQPESFDGMMSAGKAANSKGIPVIFDPVGVGATVYRTNCAMEIIKGIRPAIIRGNASEMNRLIGGQSITKGVDAAYVADSNAEIARTVAAAFNCIAVVSGKEDAVSNGKHTYLIQNGHPMLTRITGTGCMSSALIGCFAALRINLLHSAVAGISLMGIAGELAATSLSDQEGTGTFRVRLLDFISLMNKEMWLEGVRIIEV
ncbi:hydroxyethylthiazole kinase [Siminovitchia terrae]|uniref:Hydroxyethylthiazole kinase n=1 Tax=Siminovitchia terrae TaxID=1914933 RepID=A0A429X5Q4_SIMTE|nr:hydroxyethylthiazole kinase [Siminovitchia terrae]RST58613.1 hydroxyethylthiazole kinase [Siminovitchia terrae]GIN92747.1 hydroxyethylthiazole kinase [Siminovitchia terrae]GIN96143.1 hydroxyethylthiazole kinase [Siminovitchia terrae]